MDRDFLFGVIAVQLGQATPQQVMAAASAFVADRSRSVPERLLADGVFTPERYQMLSGMVDEAITIIRAHGRQGEITITPTLSPNIPDIRGNQYQLEQVVVNLLLNAMQAMSNNKGVVTVATEYSSDSGQIRIIITDRGDGISPEDQKQLFNPFFTTRIDKGGSGLGLYISKYIVTEHNGYLTVESEYGVGTVATVYIPVKRG